MWDFVDVEAFECEFFLQMQQTLAQGIQATITMVQFDEMEVRQAWIPGDRYFWRHFFSTKSVSIKVMVYDDVAPINIKKKTLFHFIRAATNSVYAEHSITLIKSKDGVANAMTGFMWPA